METNTVTTIKEQCTVKKKVNVVIDLKIVYAG